MGTQFPWQFSELNNISLQIQGRALFLLAIFLSIISLIFLLSFMIRRTFIDQTLLLLPTHVMGLLGSSEPHVAAVVVARSLGLDAATISSLPVIMHKSMVKTTNNVNDEDTECCICLSLFEDEEMVKVLPICHHTYHSACVDQWFNNQSSCPLCRASLDIVRDESNITAG